MPNQIEGKMGVINMAPTYYVLAGSKEEFFNYKTLQKYQELDELSSFSADKANDKPNIGQYKNQVAPFVQSLKEFPDKETFLALSFSKYQSYMDQLTQNLKETGALGEALLQKLGDTGVAYTNQIKLFAGITQLKITQSGSYNDLINSLETDKKIPPATKKAILKSLDILPASSELLDDAVNQLILQVVAEYDQALLKHNQYIAQQNEYDAQKTLLFEIIARLASPN